ncbi:AAA family ATPase [Erwinia amylovora]|nr:AAA family ATPase [Erwinia amylovora]CBX79378.1 Chaperone protein clpB [Erwinia amylovora ATCC BAA-2158]UDJ98761.1 AAA family ATPase [Erwinia amylovora]UDK89183.1 AAA family ATPase [Erwinia amylovora]UDK92576.1 AAA family ATPase [Erwinia amylovora]
MIFIITFTGMTDKWFYKLISEGQFPKPIKPGSGSRWFKSEVEPGCSRVLHSSVCDPPLVSYRDARNSTHRPASLCHSHPVSLPMPGRLTGCRLVVRNNMMYAKSFIARAARARLAIPVITEAVRKRPYSVVLLDEVEKAHLNVMNLFCQVCDRGFMRDGEGREIDFRNTVVLMTAKPGSDHIMQLLDKQPEATEGDLHELLRPILSDHFQPALLARFQTVVYRPLAETAMRTIVQMKLAQVSKRLHRHYGLKTHIGESWLDALTAACLLPDTGARNVDSLLNQQILPVLSQQLLTHMAAKQKPQILRLD